MPAKTPAQRMRASMPDSILELLAIARGSSLSATAKTDYKPNETKHCPLCKGHRQDKINCRRCAGTGRVKDTTLQKSSRVNLPGFGLADVSALVAGLDQHKLDAALLLVNDDEKAAERLYRHLKNKVVKVQSHKWPEDPDYSERGQKMIRRVRCQAIARMAVDEFRMSDGHLSSDEKALRLRISHDDLYRGWNREYTPVLDRLISWTHDTARHMRKQSRDIYRKTG